MIVIHHNDMDGRAAAAIVRMANERHSDETITFIEMDYSKKLPLDKIGKGEAVFVVDFNLEKDNEWEKLLDVTHKVVWIDHHKTSMESPGPQHTLPGVRNTSACAAMLTWQYYMREDPPEALQLINDWDCWFHKMKDTIPFKLGMDLEDTHPTAEIWDNLFHYDALGYSINDIVQQGGIIQLYQEKTDREYWETFGFKTEFEGYKAFAINRGRVNSQAFGEVLKKYDLGISFVLDGKTCMVSVYSDNPEIDCGALCKKWGGGGHPGAAGFQETQIPSFLMKDLL